MFKKLSITFIICQFILSIFTANSIAQLTPTDPNIRMGKLENGMRYYIKPNAKPEKKVELRLVVNAGSIQEDEDQLGLAHFNEHMLFNGTKRYPKNKLVDFLQSIGVSFGADLNAYTSFNETVYILPIPTDKESNLEKGFEVLEDWAAHTLFTEEEIDSERGIVLEESRMGKGADDRMMQKYLPQLFAGSRYADRLPIGKDEIIKNASYETVRRFYKEWYRPNNMAVFVVGDITFEKGMELIKKHFAHLKNPANARPRINYEVPKYEDATAMVLTDKEATNYVFQLNFSATKAADPTRIQTYRNSIVKSLLSEITNKRLRELTQSENPPYIYAGTNIGGGYVRGYENLALVAIPSDNVAVAVKAAVSELTKLREFGVNETELELAKKQMHNRMEKLYNERNTTPSSTLVEEYIRNFLTDEPIPGIEYEYDFYQKAMPNITVKELNDELNKWLAKDKTQEFFTFITGPDSRRIKLPTDKELVNLVKEALNAPVTANKEKTIASNLLTKEPKAGYIVSQSEDKELGTTTYTLSNGLKVTTKSTDFKNDEIILKGIKIGGIKHYDVKDKASANYATTIMETMGYGQFTPSELSDFLSGKTVRLNTGISGNTSTISGSSSVKDLETLFQLIYLKTNEIRKDEGLFKGYITKQKSQLQFLTASPQYAFVDTLYKTIFNNDPRRDITIPAAEDFDAIKLHRAIEIYKELFGNAVGMEFFIVGNINDKTIKPLIEKYIASLPTNGEKLKIKDDGLRSIKGYNELTFKKGREQQSLIMSMYYGEVTYSEDFELKTEMLAEAMNLKVIEELREKMSAIYGGGFNASVIDKPIGKYQLTLYLPCGPENVQPLINAAEAEIANIRKVGVDEKELTKVKLSMHEQHKEGLQQNRYWVNNLIEIMYWNRDKNRFLKFDEVIDKVTSNELKDVANTIFGGTTSNNFKAILYPEDKE